MIKRLAWLVLALMMLVSLSACGTDVPSMEDTQVQDQTQTQTQEQLPQEGEQVITEEEQQIIDQIIADSEAEMGQPPAADEYAWQTREGVVQDDGILVECTIYDLTLPTSWDGHYTVEETDNWVSLYCADDMLEDYGGLLCMIGWTTEEMDYIGMPGHIMLGQMTMDGVTYDVVAMPMEVAEADASELYLTMKADVIDVLGTLDFHENVEFVPAE